MTANPDILKGNLLKAIVKLGYPMALASLAQTLYNLADTFWLGKLGKEALSAPVVAFFPVFLALSIGMGFSIAGTSLVSQYTGAKQTENAHKTAGNLLLYMTIISIVCSILGLIFGIQLLNLLQTPDGAMDMIYSYYWIMMAGMPLAYPIFVYQSVMNGYGETLSPLKIELITAVVNVVLDPILIFGWFGFPAMGVEGAAITTIFTRALASLIGMYYFFSGKKGIKLKLHHLKPDKSISRLLFKTGIPSAFGYTGTSLGFMVVMGFVNVFGTAVISAYGIAIRFMHIFMLPAMGISSAVTAIVGQNLGAKNIARAKDSIKKGILLMLSVTVPSVIVIELLAKQVTQWFIPGDPLVHQIGETVFYISTPAILFFGLATVLQSAFQGAGYNVPVMVFNFTRVWLVRIPFIYIVSFVIMGGPENMNAHIGLWWSITFSSFVSFLVILVWYLRGTWTKPRIEEAESKLET